MDDMTVTDMGPFLERQQRRSQGVFISIFTASVVAAATIFAYGVGATGAPGAVFSDLWVSILVYPLFVAVFWAAVTRWSRTRPSRPDGSLPMSADDARSIARVANAGTTFVACLGVVVVASQAGLALRHFGAIPPLKEGGDWLGRSILLAGGVLMAYFGNAWSRMPVPRAPGQDWAKQMKFKRQFAWVIVIHGLLQAAAALLLPIPAMFVAIIVVSASLVLCLIASVAKMRGENRQAAAQ